LNEEFVFVFVYFALLLYRLPVFTVKLLFVSNSTLIDFTLSVAYCLKCVDVGTEFLYSSHAWTLLSAVVEGSSGRKFIDVMRDVFHSLGLENTYLDEDQPIIPHRSRYT